MTFRMIAFKIFKANIKKYRLFIVCNLATVAILYSFISVSVNETFKNPSTVDPMISSNIYAPTALVLLFTCLFIPYTQIAFIKDRSKDYGILLTIGMSENEVRNNVLIENLVLCVIFLLSGLVLGTFVSLFFWGVIRYGVGIQGIPISVSTISYKVTAFYVAGIFLLSLMFNVVRMFKSTILDKIKYTEKTEGGTNSSLLFCVIGIALTIVSFLVMFFVYHIHSNIWFISVLLCIFGSFLIFFNGEALIDYYKQKYDKQYRGHLFLLSDLKYYYRKNRMIFFVTTWIFFAIFFFLMFSLVTYSNFTNNAVTYHPYHMAYADIRGSFQPLGDEEISVLAEKQGNLIVRNDRVKFIRNNSFTIFCVEDVNTILGKNYKVAPDSFIYVYPFDANDGYEHDMNINIPGIHIDSHEGAKQFSLQETIVNPLFGQINSISNRILLMNQDDYDWITADSNDYRIHGTLHLYDFSSWRQSGEIVHEVWNKLVEKNNIEKENRFYQISSRIDAHHTALQSSNFLTFVVLFVCLLLYSSAIIMIHFKIKMEYQEDKKKYNSLYRIGIQENEIKKMIDHKIRVIYSIPFIYAVLIAIVNSYYTNSSYGYGLTGIFSVLLTLLVFLPIHLAVYIRYSRACYQKVVSEMVSSR